MPKFHGTKNLHIGEDIHAEPDADGRGYVITLDAKQAKALGDYLASEGFVPADSAPSGAE